MAYFASASCCSLPRLLSGVYYGETAVANDSILEEPDAWLHSFSLQMLPVFY